MSLSVEQLDAFAARLDRQDRLMTKWGDGDGASAPVVSADDLRALLRMARAMAVINETECRVGVTGRGVTVDAKGRTGSGYTAWEAVEDWEAAEKEGA